VPGVFGRLRRETDILLVLALLLAAGILSAGLTGWLMTNRLARAQPVREYTLEIVPTDIDYGGGNVWHAWTYKLADSPTGSVPGPTLYANVGERLRVRVRNRHNLVHSFHTHLTHYSLESDGSQLNTITGRGAGAMIPPGGEYVYEFEPQEPGIYYYHCHSADGGLTISQHIHQGLYGAIIVRSKDDPPMQEEVIFMAETGHEKEGNAVPFFIMNGLGIPGGEHKLEEIYHQGGMPAVAAQLGKTVPTIKAKVGQPLRVHVINIGDQIHSFHVHHASHISETTLQGRPWPANVVPLVPGQAETLRITFTEPGLWLFHCHVVQHADAGMIGLFSVEE
jgi:FtsP/CotA-like multicopper oxidase with cupredoxin domain